MDNLCTADGSLAPDWFYHRTNTLRTSEKWTPLNSEQRTLISPRRTLANTKLPPKTDSEATPSKCRCLSTAFVTPPSLDSKTKNYISTVDYRASLSRQCKVTERSKNPTSRPISHYHAYQKYTSVFRTRSGGSFHCSRKCCYKQQSSVYLYASFYIHASIVLLLPSCYWTNLKMKRKIL